MNLSISNIAWGAEHDTEMYQYLHDIGFQGLEIAPTRVFPENPYDKLSQVKDWADQLKEEYGLVIPSMQSIWYGHQENIFGTREERKILVNYTKKAIDFAEIIGCPNLVFGNPRNRDTEDIPSNYQIAIDFFREIGDYAAEHHTTIAIEANPTIYNTRFINTTEQAVEMADNCNNKGIRVNVDLGTIIYNEEDIQYLRQIPEFINHVHISEPRLKPLEQRKMHKLVFDILNDINYEKFVSIEMSKVYLEQAKELILYLSNINI